MLIMLLILIPSILSAQAISVFNANSVADLIETESARIKTFRGRFVYKKNRESYNGTITYVAPDKLLMQFGPAADPEDKKIMSDGAYIWVQEGDIIARQRMTPENNPAEGWNIRRLRQQYIPTAPSTGLEIKYGEIDAYQIVMQPKVNTSSFRNIDIIADKKGLIRRIRGTSRVGVTTELTFYYNEINREYDENEFRITTTEETQIYDNIFD